MLIWLSLLALFVFVLYRLGRMDRRIRDLERSARGLATQAPSTPPAAPAQQAGSSRPPPITRPLARRPRPAARRPFAPGLVERWRPIERQLIENWTGILGAALLVAGVAFLSIYTALFVGPVLRTLMIVALCTLLLGVYFALRARPPWQLFAVWLRSAAAGLFLFACFGAIAVDGLRWIDDPWLGLASLTAGIVPNLYLAFAGGSQRFAALHTVLGLIPLAIIPAGEVSFLLGTLVALFGVGLAYRARWDLHLLLTLLAFAAFEADWLLGMGGRLFELELRAIGVSGALAVGAAAALIHYRKEYESPVFERLPFIVHLVNWALVGAAVAYYSRQTGVRGVALFAAGAVAFALARRGKALGIRWAHLLDTLVAQGLVVAGLVSFYPLAPNGLAVVGAVFAQVTLYTRVVASEGERLFDRTGIYLLHGLALLLGVWALGALEASAAERTQNALVLLVCAAVGLVRHHYFVRAHGESFDSLSVWGPLGSYLRSEFVAPLTRAGAPRGEVSLLGIGIGILLACAFVSIYDEIWVSLLALSAVGAALAVARWNGSRGLTIGSGLALAAAHGVGWLASLQGPAAPLDHVLQLAPLLALAGVAAALTRPEAWGPYLRRFAIYLGALDLGLAAFVLAQPVSPLVPGVLWLCLSLVALELALRARAADATALLHAGYGYAAAFGAAYVAVHMQAEVFLGPFPARMLVELFALLVFGFWFLSKPGQTLESRRSWTHVQPYFLEASLLLVATALALATTAQWRPCLWGVIAIAAVWSAPASVASRLGFWALAFFWACALDVAAVSSFYETPSPYWYEQAAFTGVVAIGLQIAFILRAREHLDLAQVVFPPGAGWLAGWSRQIAARPHFWIYYPFFLCVAVFLYWRFDRAVLTLLWAGEAFVVFSLAAVLRENHFRQLALAALAVCLVRLVFFDLEQTGTLMRGLVFLGVGILMLGMNSIYTRFRSRFE